MLQNWRTREKSICCLKSVWSCYDWCWFANHPRPLRSFVQSLLSLTSYDRSKTLEKQLNCRQVDARSVVNWTASQLFLVCVQQTFGFFHYYLCYSAPAFSFSWVKIWGRICKTWADQIGQLEWKLLYFLNNKILLTEGDKMFCFCSAWTHEFCDQDAVMNVFYVEVEIALSLQPAAIWTQVLESLWTL